MQSIGHSVALDSRQLDSRRLDSLHTNQGGKNVQDVVETDDKNRHKGQQIGGARGSKGAINYQNVYNNDDIKELDI